MDGNTVSTTCRTFRAKLLSVLLAVLMLFTSIPAMFPASASGSGGSGNPIVLTNASVEFKDKNYGPLSEVDSGEIFYLMATIAGNNVEEGEVDSYRIEISDKNLLLPNFAGNGFKDGAVYNGYTLHVNSDGSRYITFNIDNGQTKQVRLQAKFQNGKTANGTKVEVKLTQESSGKSVSNQITADAAMQFFMAACRRAFVRLRRSGAEGRKPHFAESTGDRKGYYCKLYPERISQQCVQKDRRGMGAVPEIRGHHFSGKYDVPGRCKGCYPERSEGCDSGGWL